MQRSSKLLPFFPGRHDAAVTGATAAPFGVVDAHTDNVFEGIGASGQRRQRRPAMMGWIEGDAQRDAVRRRTDVHHRGRGHGGTDAGMRSLRVDVAVKDLVFEVVKAVGRGNRRRRGRLRLGRRRLLRMDDDIEVGDDTKSVFPLDMIGRLPVGDRSRVGEIFGR